LPAPAAAKFNIPPCVENALTPEECFRAVEECGTPTVAIPGGEPLLHPQIGEIVEGLVARKKYIICARMRCCLSRKSISSSPASI